MRRIPLYGCAAIVSALLVGGMGYVASERLTIFQSVLGQSESKYLPIGHSSTANQTIEIEALVGRAEVALAIGEVAEALALYEQALEQGGDVSVMRRLFDTALLLGDREKAEQALGLLSFRGVPESTLTALRGYIHLREGEIAEAHTLFSAELQRSEHRFGLLLVAIASGEHEEAQEHISALLTSTDPLVQHSARVIQGAYDEFSLFEDGKPVHLSTLLARALGQLSQWPLAILLLEEVTLREPEYRDAQLLLGYAHLMLGENETAHAAFLEAQSIDPEKAETQYFLGRTNEKLGNIDDAVTYYSYALQNGFVPRKSARDRLADIAIRRGAYEEAIGQYRAAVDEQEADPGTYRALITLLIDHRKDIEQARDLALQLGKDYGEETADTLDLIGWTALLLDDLDQAASFLHAAVEQDPLLAPAWYHKGLLEEQIGDRAEALASFRLAYELSMGIDQDIAYKAAERHNALLVSSE